MPFDGHVFRLTVTFKNLNMQYEIRFAEQPDNENNDQSNSCKRHFSVYKKVVHIYRFALIFIISTT